MFLNLRSRKGISEYIIMIISIIIIGLILIFSWNLFAKFKSNYEEKTISSINEEYMVAFVNTFLEKRVLFDVNNKKELGLDVNRDYKIKDLITISSKKVRNLIEGERKNYINLVEDYKDSLGKTPNDYFENSIKISGKEVRLYNKYLIIKYDVDKISEYEKLSSELKAQNYFVFLVQNNGKYVVVFFRGD